MAVNLENINSLFKQRFGEGPVETLTDKPYFIKMVPTTQISKDFTVPVNLRPGHSMRYSASAYENVSYKEYHSPELKDAKGIITAKFFKVEVPLGIIDSLNKTPGQTSLAYSTASYFIEDALRTNQLLAELSYMYGELGLPKIYNRTDRYAGKILTGDEFAANYVVTNTSDQILRLLLNSRVTIGTGTGVYEVVDFNDTEIRFAGTRNNPTIGTATAPTQLYIETQRANDNLGLYQLMNNTGEVLGIDGDKYRNWNSVKLDLSGEANKRLTRERVKSVASDIIKRGGIMNEDLCLFVSQETWDDLSNEFDDDRQLDSSYSKDSNVAGQKKVGLMHSNGMIEIKYHPLMKRDTAFMMTNPKISKNLITLTNNQVMSFENNKQFQSAESSSAAYVIGKMYFAPFMRDRRRHAIITGIANT